MIAIAADGSVVVDLDLESLGRADAVVESGHETVAVSLLHAYAKLQMTYRAQHFIVLARLRLCFRQRVACLGRVDPR